VVLKAEGFPEAIQETELVEEDGRVGGFALQAVVRSGAFSVLLEAKDATGKPVALKRIAKGEVTKLGDLRNVAMELRALRALLGGDSLLEFHKVLASRRYVYFVLERFGAAPGRPNASSHLSSKVASQVSNCMRT